MEAKDRLVEHLNKLRTQSPLEGAVYHLVGFFGTTDGRISTTCNTHWVGWADMDKRREIREARPVDPMKTMRLMEEIGEPAVLVNTRADLYVYLLIGGHGVVETSLCHAHIPEVVGPREVVLTQAEGFVSADSLPEEWIKRAPTRKKRMEILKRDDVRCRICGRSPNDHVDVELNVHHVMPWGQGGLTEDGNLITICKTCHDGLEPHFDPQLFAKVGWDPYAYLFKVEEDYREQVLRYRNLIAKLTTKRDA